MGGVTHPPAVPGVTIRPERFADVASIGTVVSSAFGTQSVADLVSAIRASPDFVPEWSLVAEAGGEVAGHVMVSYVTLADEDNEHRVPSLSPLAVAPERQGRGIGSALVRAVVDRVDHGGAPLVVLEGSPRFYGRLGFEHAVAHGITFDLPEWAPPEAAQVRRLSRYDPSIRGHVVYPPAFDRVAGHD